MMTANYFKVQRPNKVSVAKPPHTLLNLGYGIWVFIILFFLPFKTILKNIIIKNTLPNSPKTPQKSLGTPQIEKSQSQPSKDELILE